jgi:hypothetical protein
VIVKSRAIPANIPWKNEIDLLNFVYIEVFSMIISVSKVLVVNDETYDFAYFD